MELEHFSLFPANNHIRVAKNNERKIEIGSDEFYRSVREILDQAEKAIPGSGATFGRQMDACQEMVGANVEMFKLIEEVTGSRETAVRITFNLAMAAAWAMMNTFPECRSLFREMLDEGPNI